MSTDLTDRESLQTSTGGVWNYISPSRINLWLRCGLAFRLRYLDGIRSPTTPSLFVGKHCHAALEAFYRHRQLGITLSTGEVTRRLVEAWGPAMDEEGMSFESSGEEASLQKLAIDLVTAYLAYVPKDEAKPLAVEAAVEAPLAPATFGNLLRTFDGVSGSFR